MNDTFVSFAHFSNWKLLPKQFCKNSSYEINIDGVRTHYLKIQYLSIQNIFNWTNVKRTGAEITFLSSSETGYNTFI